MLILFQSTHPRGVRLMFTQILLIIIVFQSTHPRGVRRLRSLLVNLPILFQSTHPRGVRLLKRHLLQQLCCFNPRTHEGCDTFVLDYKQIGFVSIHAPTRGATDNNLCSDELIKFQSTHPRGVRRFTILFSRNTQSFNPRTHEGCDLLILLLLLVCVFQSTHPRGVRH